MDRDALNYPRDSLPLATPKRTRRRRLFLIVVVAVGFLFAADLAWGYRVLGYRSVEGVYFNEKYGYSVQIPPGWHLATQVMLSLNLRQLPWWRSLFYSYKSADFVVLTLFDAGSEKGVADGIDRLDAHGVGAIPYSKLLSGSYILLGVDGGLDFETAQKLIGTTLPNTTTPAVSNLKSVYISGGVNAARYSVGNESHPEYPIETVFIPYPRKAINAVADEVEGVSIRTIQDEAFSEQVFSTFTNSFRFVSDTRP